MYEQKLSNFRVVNAFLINDKGQLWIPRRSKNKKLIPLGLDSSMGGHVSAGETYEQAFARELQEELGLDAASIDYKVIGKLTPQEHGTYAFLYVCAIYSNQVPAFNPDDFCEYFWLTPQECLEKWSSGELCKSDLIKMINIYFYNQELFGDRICKNI